MPHHKPREILVWAPNCHFYPLSHTSDYFQYLVLSRRGEVFEYVALGTNSACQTHRAWAFPKPCSNTVESQVNTRDFTNMGWYEFKF